jgi:hypothetical protein
MPPATAPAAGPHARAHLFGLAQALHDEAVVARLGKVRVALAAAARPLAAAAQARHKGGLAASHAAPPQLRKLRRKVGGDRKARALPGHARGLVFERVLHVQRLGTQQQREPVRLLLVWRPRALAHAHVAASGSGVCLAQQRGAPRARGAACRSHHALLRLLRRRRLLAALLLAACALAAWRCAAAVAGAASRCRAAAVAAAILWASCSLLTCKRARAAAAVAASGVGIMSGRCCWWQAAGLLAARACVLDGAAAAAAGCRPCCGCRTAAPIQAAASAAAAAALLLLLLLLVPCGRGRCPACVLLQPPRALLHALGLVMQDLPHGCVQLLLVGTAGQEVGRDGRWLSVKNGHHCVVDASRHHGAPWQHHTRHLRAEAGAGCSGGRAAAGDGAVAAAAWRWRLHSLACRCGAALADGRPDRTQARGRTRRPQLLLLLLLVVLLLQERGVHRASAPVYGRQPRGAACCRGSRQRVLLLQAADAGGAQRGTSR